MKRLLWDFFGPHAEPTARHFQRHLAQRLTADGHERASSGVVSAGDGHCAAYCDLEDAAAETIGSALRPARVEADPA